MIVMKLQSQKNFTSKKMSEMIGTKQHGQQFIDESFDI
jgi:hypothetical protein